MDLLERFNQIPKSELTNPYQEPDWLEEHNSRPRNIAFNRTIKPEIKYVTKRGDVERFTELGKGVLMNAAYVQKEER